MSKTAYTDNAGMLNTYSVLNSENNANQNHEYNDLQEKVQDANQIRRNTSSGAFPQDKPEGRVLVLYTGGTIGMVRNKDGGISTNFHDLNIIYAIKTTSY